MYEEKKKYLNKYLLQETAVNSFKTLLQSNPYMAEDYNKKIDSCIKLRIDIEKKIEAVDDGVLCELLRQKYIFGKTLEEISYILNYSKRHIERLHIKALKEFKM